MSKTYRQPTCREDWQDITKLRFKDSDDGIVAVYIDERPELVKSPIMLIRKAVAIGKYISVYYDEYNGIHENETYNILVETEQPEPDAKMITKIMFSDFSILEDIPDQAIRVAKILEINPKHKNFVLGGQFHIRFDFVKIKEFLFTRDGETIINYDQVIEELNNE